MDAEPGKLYWHDFAQDDRVTTVLIKEHAELLKAADLMDRMGAWIESGGLPTMAQMHTLVHFARHFVQPGHLSKEETVLYPAMVEAGAVTPDVAPLAEVLGEDDVLRRELSAFHATFHDLRHGTDTIDGRYRFASAAHQTADRLRKHVQVVEAVLFPLAEAQLPQEKKEQVIAGFAVIEKQVDHDDHQAQVHALEELEGQLNAMEASSKR